MRDFRNAKAMALSLRQGLAAKTVTITHSESLELIAKTFGFENWNVLAAKIEAERTPVADLAAAAGAETLYCSFCRKSQHDVRALIAGPDVYICNECVALCVPILDDTEVERLVSARDPTDRFSAAVEIIRDKFGDQLDAYGARARGWLEHAEWSVRQADDALSRLDTGAAWTPDAFAKARGWTTRDPLAGKSREQILRQRAVFERQLVQIGERLRAVEHIQAERGEAPPP